MPCRRSFSDIEFIERALTREFPQAAQRDLDVARAKLLGVVEILEFALVPDLHGPLVLRFTADADAFGIVARIAVRRGPLGADPFAAALMALLLFLEPLLERLHDLFPRPKRLDRLHLLGSQVFFGNGLQPFFGNIGLVLAIGSQDAFEDLGKDLVETIEQSFIFHEYRARKIIEFLGIPLDDVLF